MAKITNPGRAFTLLTGHVVPREGVLIVPNDVLRGDNAPMLGGLAKSGQIVVKYDAETLVGGDVIPAASIEPTPEAKAQAEADAQLAAAAAENAALLAEFVAEPAAKKK